MSQGDGCLPLLLFGFVFAVGFMCLLGRGGHHRAPNTHVATDRGGGEPVTLGRPCDLWGFDEAGRSVKVRRAAVGEVFVRGKADDSSTEVVDGAGEHLWVVNGCLKPGASVAPAASTPDAPAVAAPVAAPPEVVVCVGNLSISAVPGRFAVWVDGEFLGDGPINGRQASCGDHRVLIRDYDGHTKDAVVTVEADVHVVKTWDFAGDAWRQ